MGAKSEPGVVGCPETALKKFLSVSELALDPPHLDQVDDPVPVKNSGMTHGASSASCGGCAIAISSNHAGQARPESGTGPSPLSTQSRARAHNCYLKCSNCTEGRAARENP
jgi:hypothetical protein